MTDTLSLPAPTKSAAEAAAAFMGIVPKPAPKLVSGTEGPPDLLVRILGTKRSFGSVGDVNFRTWLVQHLNTLKCAPVTATMGNIVVEVGKGSRTLFSCHTDTVHSKAESNTSKQELIYDPAFGHIFLADKKASGCLGGDDGVGVYIMLKMIAAKVPGSYIFHVAEECGGQGSRAMLREDEKWVKNFNRVVAFDRAVQDGQNPEVIITQGGTLCASKEFGEALALALNSQGQDFEMPYITSHNGTFTDSKIYASVVPECVNLGCFYCNQHTPNEYVDATGVEMLLAACLKIKWETLPTVRKPAPAYEPRSFKGSTSPWGGRDYGQEEEFGLYGKPYVEKKAPVPPPLAIEDEDLDMEVEDMTYVEIEDWLGEDAAVVVSKLLMEVEGERAKVLRLQKLLGIV